MLFAISQSPLRPLAVDCIVQLRDEDHAETFQHDKHQKISEITSAFNVESQMWRHHEEIGRSSAERDAKKARTDPADQRCDDNCWPERNKRDANNPRIDREPQHSRNPDRHESKGIASGFSRPQCRDVYVELR